MSGTDRPGRIELEGQHTREMGTRRVCDDAGHVPIDSHADYRRGASLSWKIKYTLYVPRVTGGFAQADMRWERTESDHDGAQRSKDRDWDWTENGTRT